MRCAVSHCKQNNAKKDGNKNSIHYHKFPTDPEQKEAWINFCQRLGIINTKTERICSLHFSDEDYEKNLQMEWGLSSSRTVRLKPGVVPRNEEEHLKIKKEFECRDSGTLSFIDYNAYIDELKLQIKTLQEENKALKKIQNDFSKSKNKLHRRIEVLTLYNTNMEKSLGHLFTPNQLTKMKNGEKRRNWTAADIAQSFTLYSTSAKAYKYLRTKNFPLPGVRTLQRWSQKRAKKTKIETEIIIDLT
ncbi:uncharacterized protein LOC119683258 [Teleopsis dalmanni]|uniref:uncharacterized protein LOC119683258 n=1 Tax=Teleopsis dalmanni TaxID=139649 RepID=UPI0018CE2FCB|nr:uncharacterized protein LOC119683258 [Teleopsis dalmanni]